MKLLFSLLFVLLPGSALADCADEVKSTWARLKNTAFHFEIAFPNAPSKMEGAFRWPEAMRYRLMGYKGPMETIFIGPRQWNFSDGRWLGGIDGGTYGATAEKALGTHASLFGFRMLASAEAFKDSICLGEKAKSGRKFVAYTYEVHGNFYGEFIDRDTIYVDPVSGFLVHQEIERESPGKPRQRQITVFKADASPTIAPPVLDGR